MTEPDVDWPRRRLPRGCAFVLFMILGAAAALFGLHLYQRHQAGERQEERARAAFVPAERKLAEAREQAVPAVDLDKTVRVIQEIDTALAQGGSLEEYLATMAAQDYRGVSPEVLRAREEVLGVLFELYATQVEQADRDATWSMVQHLGPVLDVLMISKLEVGGDASLAIPLTSTGGKVEIGKAGIDREGVRRVYEDWKAQEADHQRLLAKSMELEQALIDVLAKHATVWHDVLEDWGRLCNLRDRAYLAAQGGNWAEAEAAARQAIAQAPHEKEAHLLLALALIQGQRATPEDPDEAPRLLSAYIEQHPDSTAPALLLRGLAHERRGELDAAVLDLSQAAADYPRQAEALADMLDPYRARSRLFLRASREGNLVLELYKSTMLGAAWFSPDLHLARIAFQRGDFEAGRTKVTDHFARRRTQGQWDLVIRDLEFCERFLGEHYPLILPERGWLDLEASEATFGSKLQASVVNRSDRTLHNATLVLCLHFTDMHPDDYEPFAPRTEPVLPAHDSTRFDDVEVDFTLAGHDKGAEDIASMRAILVADEAVVWVDSVDFKREQARAQRETRMRRRAEGSWSPAARVQASQHRLVEQATTGLEQGALLATSAGIGKDDVFIDLPYLFAALAPVFTLQVAGQTLEPSQDRIEGDRIRLRFDDAADFGEGGPLAIQLQADTALTELVLTWTRDPEGRWTFQGAARSD
ncbi:MAG: tetratricopeptide repeat protein [Pseudomonadota bacterium]